MPRRLDTEAFQATLVAVADGNILNLSGLAAEAAALVGVTPATMRATIYQRRLSDRHAEALRQALRHHVEDLKALL